MNIQLYLDRINYPGPIDPTIEILSKLQILHLMNVPFENLDIHNNTKIDLTNLFDKIVTRKRGGFCYELNGLFYQLLKEIGFTVKLVSARVYDGKKDFRPEFDHMALIVKIEEDSYLVDVGFGEFSFYPIKIESDKDTNDPRGIFRIENFDENYKVVKKRNAVEMFIPEYIFSEKERQISEFHGMCNYHQTNSESHFVQKRICSLPTENGRITITGDTLKITDNGKVTERKLNTEQEIQQELWNYFGVKL
ncbi:MAG: arylamine N-acetyltransferase [Ferruginibacter sp.]